MSTLVVKCMALINDFLSLIYPRRCEACGNLLFRHETFICNYCRLNLPVSNYHLNPVNPLVNMLAGRVPLVFGLSLFLFEKEGRVQRLVHAIKYQEQKELGVFLGKWYATQLSATDLLTDVSVIVPVPLHRKRLRERGFNQSAYFAAGLAQVLDKRVEEQALERWVETGSQTKRGKYQRWENLQGAFRVTDPDRLKNRHVLLVDDVVTTGATVEAVWLALKEIEGIRLSVITIAFATH